MQGGVRTGPEHTHVCEARKRKRQRRRWAPQPFNTSLLAATVWASQQRCLSVHEKIRKFNSLQDIRKFFKARHIVVRLYLS